MKTLKLFLFIYVVIFLQACYKPGKIQVQNKISQVKIMEVMWGKIYLASELLPGQTSNKLTIGKYDEKLPSKNKVTFKMTANDKSVYLETIEEYLLDKDDDLLIVLSDDTKVRNPNE